MVEKRVKDLGTTLIIQHFKTTRKEYKLKVYVVK